MGRDTFRYIRLLKAPSSLALNTSREGASTSEQPVPVSHYPLSKEFLPYIESKSALFQFKTITSHPITTLPDKESLLIFPVGPL